jgi:hypothetical protein
MSGQNTKYHGVPVTGTDRFYHDFTKTTYYNVNIQELTVELRELDGIRTVSFELVTK